MSALHPEAPKPETTTAAAPTIEVQSTQSSTQQAIDKTPTTNLLPESTNPVAAEEKAEDPNWRAFREARKKDREGREAAELRANEKEREAAALKAAMEAAFSVKQAPTPQAYQQYYGMNQEHEETEDQRIDRKVNELLEKKQQQYQQQQAQQEQQEYPKRLLKDMPDFSQVCSQENLDYLDYHFPEVSRPLQRLGEGYDKWYDTYHAVKKLIPNHANARKEAVRADVNSNKPRSMASSGPSPTGEAPRESWQQSEERRAANWSRMQRTLKGV